MSVRLSMPPEIHLPAQRNRKKEFLKQYLLLLVLPFSILVSCSVAAPAQNVVVINAGTPSEVPQPSSYQEGSSTSPTGRNLGLNSMYLTLDGKPWLPVMGEFHYSRFPEADWEEEILKMKAAGVQIVSTYVIWIHQEEIEGQFDWSGRRDLRHFVQLCAQHGMYVFVRIGPWTHGETRNGGFPDWLLKKGPRRRDDPEFMGWVAKYYAQIGQQLQGLMWKDGGPVIGIQLSNEYAARGPGQGAEYILALKKLAIASGLDVPLYTVTGWDNAVVPQGQVLPVFGGYPGAPWDASLKKLPPSEVYAFRFGSRVSGNMGMMGAKEPIAGASTQTANASGTPFLTAEMGGGIEDTYYRRPVIEPDDVAAMAPVMLGSGVNLYGIYMFQGGENPEGKLTTLQESQATGYPNDLPVKSYDFQAPLGEFGQERESFRKLKVFDYFLNAFGPELAPMSPHAPEVRPRSPADFSVLRSAVRSRGESGFLFVNNYVRGYAMPERQAVQFRIRLPGSVLRIPARPVDIPSGVYFIWPFNLDLQAVKLRYSTAQLFTRIHDASETTWFFEEIPAIPAEFVFDDAPGLRIHSAGAAVRRSHGAVTLSEIQPGLENPIALRTASGHAVKIVLLTEHEAENAWKVTIRSQERLIETNQQFFAGPGRFFLDSEGAPASSFEIYPAVGRPLEAEPAKLRSRRFSNISRYSAILPEVRIALRLEQIQPAGEAPSVRLGPRFSWRPRGVAMAPPDSAFQQAAKWRIVIPAGFLAGVRNVFLDVGYTGDIGCLSSNGELLDDNFYNGLPWKIGLRRFANSIRQGPLELSILSLRKDAPIFLEKRYWPNFGDRTQAVSLTKLSLVPEYEFTIRTGPE